MQADTLAGAAPRSSTWRPTVIVGGSGGARVVDAHRGAAPRRGRRARGVVDQRRRLRAHEPGHALLRAARCAKAWDRRHGGRRRAAGVGRGARAATRRTGSGSSTRTRASSSPRWSGGCSRTARAATTWCPGSPTPTPRALDLPTLVFRSGESDAFHTRATSEQVAALLPNARLVEPPWGDREWIERQGARAAGGGLFARWPLLAPQLLQWSSDVLK